MGEWYQNKRHGKGDMYWYSTNEAYSGQWEFGFQHGQGQHMWTVESSDNTQVIALHLSVSAIAQVSRDGGSKSS